MWGRKKRAETDDPSPARVAPVSYWATHAEPAASSAGTTGSTDGPVGRPVLASTSAALMVGGKAVDPASPEGRWLLSLEPDSKARRMLDRRGRFLVENGLDTAVLRVLAQPGHQKHAFELMPLVMRHARGEIPDAQFEAEQRRIVAGG